MRNRLHGEIVTEVMHANAIRFCWEHVFVIQRKYIRPVDTACVVETKLLPPLASKAACRFVGWSPHLLGFQSLRGECLAVHAARPAALCAAPLGDENQYRIIAAKQAPETKHMKPKIYNLKSAFSRTG